MKKEVFIGFDGYIDQILRPISSVHGDCHQYFSTINDMGDYLKEKSGRSCSIQLERVSKQLGGNGPLFARTLKQLGVPVKLAGMFGTDSNHPILTDVFSKDELCSFSDPMETTALEFMDGKVMMCPTAPDIQDPLETLLQAAERSSFSIEAALESPLLAFLNWGEIYFMQTLWDEIYERYISKESVKNDPRIIFFDPADVSSHEKEKIRAMLHTIQKYGSHRRVILSVNENEALQIGKKLFDLTDCEEIMHTLQHIFVIPEIVVHSNTMTRSLVNGSEYRIPTLHIDHPLISTGAGDNFNAGYCYAKLNGGTAEECIHSAHKVSSFYISHGYPATSDLLV